MFDLSPSTMTPRERREAVFTFQPVDHLPRQEFGFWPEVVERWQGEGLPPDWRETNLFGFDDNDHQGTRLDLGWVESPLLPGFEQLVLEETANYQVIQDTTGRVKRIFRDRPGLAMPTYLRHAVASAADWYDDVKPRLDPATPARWEAFEANRAEIAAASAGGAPPFWVSQGIIGGYMHLRNMFGPEGALYAFYDMPDVVRDIMENWLGFMDYSLARVQAAYGLDELLLGEDICYKAGMLISPTVFKEFLQPYYQELVARARRRNPRPLYFSVDTDGRPDEAIQLYLDCGMTAMTPFEVASGQDVVAVGERYPQLVILGGIDKRLATDGADLAIMDRELERIIPTMLRRGGYLPTFDHGVPPDVPLANYLHYRQRMLELDH
ncbi:MAG TPA: uroporphyrinogen decarboxylase family protein [Armatimonadota bacterium]|jgi:uroporphyrinogen decarboxylase